jgi:predicted Zn-dependent peptidase
MKALTRTTLGIALAVIVAVAPSGRAQEPAAQPSTAGVVKKGKAPVSNEILKLTLPRPHEVDLPNGARLMVLEDHRLPRVTFQIIIPGAGGYHDPDSQIGLAGYTAQMMREGTKTRTSLQMAQDLETMAANVGVGAGVSAPVATLSGGALTENFEQLFDVAADVLLNPTFPADEWDRLKTRARAALLQQRAQPAFLAQERFNQVIYGSHPAGRISATPATLDAITRDAMIGVHRARYVPDHALIAFAGDITLADARMLVETKLAGWKKAGVAKPAVSEPPALGARKVYLVDRPNSVQTSLRVGTQAIRRTDPDYFALTTVNRVLGGTMGRLFRHLREEKGYTYGVGSGFGSAPFVTAWVANTDVRTEVTDAALTDLLADIDDLRQRPVPADELNDAKRALVASFALALENPQSLLGNHITSWTFNLPADYWDTYPARISAVTPEQAMAVAKKYWDPDRLQIVAVGDASKIRDTLAKKGTLEIYDSEGKRGGE